MRIPTVENFLFCLKLETGGKVLGWISCIGAAIALFVFTFVFGFAAINYPAMLNATSVEQVELLKNAQYIVTLILFVLVVYSAFSLYASIQVIRSVKNRSSRQAKPYLILVGLETIMAFLTILHFTWSSAIQAIFGTVVNGYLFICIYSMWEMFRDEAMRGHNRQYQPGSVFDKV